MPIVDYNRIYRVRSQERRPVLNSVHVPDAAGALIRAGVPAAGAAMPGLRARLDDVNARHRERAARDRDRFRAIGDLVGVGRDVALAYAGAVERRDEADLNALQAAWQDHMNQGAEEAWRRPYRRGGANGAKPDGPLVAIRELDAAFDGSDAMNGARPAVKQRFAEWRRRAGQTYYSKAQRLQADAQDDFQQNALLAKWQAADAAVHSLFGKKLDDETEWEMAVQAAVEGKIEDEKFTLSRRRGVEMLPEQEAIRRRALRQGYEVDRAKTMFAICAASTDPNTGEFELQEGLRIANEADLDDDVRVMLRGTAEAARQSRERNVAAALRIDNQKADRLADKIGMGAATEQEAAEFDAIMNRLPDQDKAARLATRQHAAEFKEWQDWSKTYIATIPTGEGATLEATLGAIGAARREAARLSPRAQSLAEKSLLPFRPVEDEYGKMCVGAIDVLCSLGIWNGQDVDLRRTRDILTDAVESGIIDARKFDSLFSAAQRSAEARASRAGAMPGPGTGEEFQRVMRRYLPDRVVDRFTQIDVKSHALAFTDRFDESGSYDTPEKWSDRSNAVLATMVNAMTRFHALQATGRLKPEQTLDSFVAEVMTNDENYRQMTDEAVMKAFDDRIGALEDAATQEDARRLNPYFRTSYDAPRFDLMPGKQK